jgi:hypothetical protein
MIFQQPYEVAMQPEYPNFTGLIAYLGPQARGNSA